MFKTQFTNLHHFTLYAGAVLGPLPLSLHVQHELIMLLGRRLRPL
jgi:hypothetical protein